MIHSDHGGCTPAPARVHGQFRWIGLLVVAALAAGGCEGVKHLWVSINPSGEAPTQTIQPRYYPADMIVGGSLNVELIRVDRKHIVIDNRTAAPYHDVTLWLDKQWGADLDTIPIGRGDPIELVRFINEHGEPFPVGSFLEPDKSRTLVLGDLQQTQGLHKLIVRLPEDWQQR